MYRLLAFSSEVRFPSDDRFKRLAVWLAAVSPAAWLVVFLFACLDPFGAIAWARE